MRILPVLFLPTLIAGLVGARGAHAKPTAPQVFCDTYDTSPLCSGGLVACTTCHTTPPQRNVYGVAIADALANANFEMALVDALILTQNDDADGDGFSNADEIAWGTLPADAGSFPVTMPCPGPDYDPAYAFKRLSLDVCGEAPSYEQMSAFLALSSEAQMNALPAALDACLDSEFWRGKNGALWELAHKKIRPIGALKLGEDQGSIPVSDYYDDYNLFVYTQIDDHDARDVLLADYFVTRQAATSTTPTLYEVASDKEFQNVQLDRRAGLLTTNWYLIYFIMFTPVPRTAAAQAYRAYLGMDIAKLQGLRPVDAEPVDWDDKGVTDPKCSICHSTLDPLTYPFTRYEGFPGARYNPNRMQSYPNEGPDTPEQGVLLGQPVSDLMQWAQIAANSDEFAVATTLDYWMLLVGREPTTAEQAVFEQLWRNFKTEHAFSVERMLHELIMTEAYGAR